MCDEDSHRHLDLVRERARLEGLVRGQAQRIDHLATRLTAAEEAVGEARDRLDMLNADYPPDPASVAEF